MGNDNFVYKCIDINSLIYNDEKPTVTQNTGSDRISQHAHHKPTSGTYSHIISFASLYIQIRYLMGSMNRKLSFFPYVH